MLAGWEKQYPGRIDNIFGALQKFHPRSWLTIIYLIFIHLQLNRSGEPNQADEACAISESVKPYTLPPMCSTCAHLTLNNSP